MTLLNVKCLSINYIYIYFKDNEDEAGCGGYMHLILTFWQQRQAELSEFKASLQGLHGECLPKIIITTTITIIMMMIMMKIKPYSIHF